VVCREIRRVFTLSIVLLATACGPWPAPSDTSIVARFNAHRGEFKRLLEMFRHDAPHIPLDAPPVSAERQAEYTKILKAIGSDCIVDNDFGSGRAQFFMWSTGMSWAGQGKSILFSPSTEPSPLVASTDDYRRT
jgi:hypothetical protein